MSILYRHGNDEILPPDDFGEFDVERREFTPTGGYEFPSFLTPAYVQHHLANHFAVSLFNNSIELEDLKNPQDLFDLKMNIKKANDVIIHLAADFQSELVEARGSSDATWLKDLDKFLQNVVPVMREISKINFNQENAKAYFDKIPALRAQYDTFFKQISTYSAAANDLKFFFEGLSE